MVELIGSGVHLRRVSFPLNKSNANGHMEAVMGVGSDFRLYLGFLEQKPS
jgi:hypothetical protein